MAIDPTKNAIKVIATAADKAANKIDIATNKAANLLAEAADKATTALASAARDANILLANNASEATKGHNDDHDLLIRLETKMQGLKEDIKDIKDGTSANIADHETRIFALENSKSKQTVMVTIGIALIVVLSSLIIYHLFGINV